MKLKVIHLLRRLERIERDLEELDGMLSSLPMDREYSLRLRDSLIEESSRLKEFKQKILLQRVVAEGGSVAGVEAVASQDDETQVSIQVPEKSANNGSSAKSKSSANKESNHRSENGRARQEKSEKAPKPEKKTEQAFEFRFE
ncbi:MAG: hypothetical protein KDK23_15205 [Leptospiraceae bacterium]|nr:hypothetical protein [Leptospiraceae bacterium]